MIYKGHLSHFKIFYVKVNDNKAVSKISWKHFIRALQFLYKFYIIVRIEKSRSRVFKSHLLFNTSCMADSAAFGDGSKKMNKT